MVVASEVRNDLGQFINQGGKSLVLCAQCGHEFSLYPSDIKRGHRFCSDKCAMRWFSETVRGENHHRFSSKTIVCELCGSSFEVKPASKRRFCSSSCSSKKMWLEGKGSPGVMNELERQRASQRMKAGGAIKALMGCVKTPRISIPQGTLFNKLKERFPDAELEYKIGSRLIDIAIPSKKLAIEYDGAHWHQDRAKDMKRDWELLGLGWITIRVNSSNVERIEEILN